jgi:hypothetical protein
MIDTHRQRCHVVPTLGDHLDAQGTLAHSPGELLWLETLRDAVGETKTVQTCRGEEDACEGRVWRVQLG